jgi:hypothetical protein
MSEKKKLTLSINSEVIEKAKELGLNLSEITETALKISALGHDEEKLVTPDKLRNAYRDILEKISKILIKWDMRLEIGSYSEWTEYTNSDGKKGSTNISYEYFLYENEVYLWAEFSDEEPIKTWTIDNADLPITKFYDPEKIITILIDQLHEKAMENKETLDKLQILKNILDLSGLSK